MAGYPQTLCERKETVARIPEREADGTADTMGEADGTA